MSALLPPYVITLSDGVTMRTLHPPALGRHRAEVERALSAILFPAETGTALAFEPAPRAQLHATETMTQGEIARAQGYAGQPCSRCGGWKMKQAGHCMVCDECGETTGCS